MIEAKSERSIYLPPGSVFRKWKVIKKLGEGSFGAVYQVANIKKVDEEAALKVEPIEEKESMIQMEVAILKSFRSSSVPHPHVCEYIDSGATASFRYMIMKLCGPNLTELRKCCPRRRFSECTSIRLAIQCLHSIESLHRIGFIHRDIKPANYAIGLGCYLRVVYLLDYGLARQYVDRLGRLRPARPHVGFRGTVRYASLNAHLRRDLARHDDMWSLLYMVIELVRGKLPWRKIGEKETVARMKKEASADTLLKGMPREFYPFYERLEKLQFRDAPPYEWFEEQLREIMRRKGTADEEPYDWEKQEPEYDQVRKVVVQASPFMDEPREHRRKKEREQEEKSRLSDCEFDRRK